MIDSNNKLNSLSKGLIDSVRGVMEGKKLDPVGKEDGDIDNDGDVDSSDKYLHNRRKAIKASMKKEEVEAVDEATLSAKAGRAGKDLGKPGKNFEKIADAASKKYGSKEAGLRVAGAVLKKMRNEDVENLDELSRDTLRRYRMKAKSIGDNEEGDINYRSKGRDLAARKTHGGQWGMPKAKVMASEEVEQLDEGMDAKDLYKHHHNHASALLKSIADHLKTHADAANKAINYRGEKGPNYGHAGEMKYIADRLHDIHSMVAQQHMNESFDEELTLEDIEQIDELKGATIKSYIKKATADKNFHDKQMHSSDKEWVDGKWKPRNEFDKKAKYHTNELNKRRAGLDRAYDKMTKEDIELDESPVDGVAPGSMANDGHLCATKVFHKEWAEGTPIYSQHAEPDEDGNIAWYDVMFDHGIEKHVMTEDLDILMSETHERHGKKMKEEVEELDELSKGAMLKYLSANKKSDAAAQEKGDFSKSVKRMRGTDLAVRKYTAGPDSKYVKVPATEEVDKDLEDELKAQRQTKKSVEDAKKKYGMKEDVEQVDEARGRPRKNPQPAGHSDEPEPRQHIIQQLQRAKLSMRGGEHVTFKNGEKHLVHGSHASKLLNRYAGMKPNEKEDFQKKIGASHEGLKSEL